MIAAANLPLASQHMLMHKYQHMSIYDPVFSSAQVAKAAGMTHVNFRAYLSRETTGWRPIGSMRARTADRAGAGHKFSIYDACGYALAALLVEYGVDPRVAFERAMFDFAHGGGQEYQPDGSMLERDPSDVFDVEKHGRTLFVFSQGSSKAQCIAQRAISDPVTLLFTPERRLAGAAIVIDLNSLRERVFDSLQIDRGSVVGES